MKIPIRTNHSNSRLANLDKLNERETWHKLVVKVILWKDGIIEGGTYKSRDKITLKEWDTYCKRMIKTNTTYGRQKVLSNLNEIKVIIKKHGGFEEAN